MQTVKAIIFDFDGTLYDFKGMPKNLILNSLFNLFRIKAERDVRRSMKGIDFGNAQEYFLEQGKRLCEQGHFSSAEQAMVWYKNIYMKNMIHVLEKKYHARPDVPELCTYLKSKNIQIVVYSDYCCVEERMKAVGLDRTLADFIFSAEELGGLKPAAAGFLHIAELCNCAPEEILVVGDRADTDGQGAKNASMQFIQIRTHKTEHQEASEFPLLYWEEFKDLIMSSS